MKSGIIYMAKFPSGKVYIGKTIKTLEIRKSHHISNSHNKKSGKFNSKLSKAIRKYGNNIIWKVICENITEDEILIIEKEMIKRYDSYDNGYNSTPEGTHGFTNKNTPAILKARYQYLSAERITPCMAKVVRIILFMGKSILIELRK